MKTSNSKIGDFLLTGVEMIGNWLVKHAKIVMPVVLAVCVVITVVVSVNANKKGAQIQENIEANSTTVGETGEETSAIPQVPLKENDDPKIGALMNAYYTAMAEGDIDTIRTLVDEVDDEEIVRIEEKSKYQDHYPTVDIYTKAGPLENTYLVYVCSEVKFTDYEEPVPGMQAFYVCVNESGDYYIKWGESSQSELDYITEVSLQDDVVDLNNKIAASYNDMLAEDVELAQFLFDLQEEIKKDVGQMLAQSEESAQTDGTAPAGGEAAETAQSAETAANVTRVKAIDVVNIRSSDSETADKLGKAAIGDEFKLLEKIGNGWSKIEYDGKDAYIKSEFLEDIAEAEGEAAGTETAETDTETQTASIEPTGTVTAVETVRVRSGPSETSEKIATAYAGEKLDVIMKQADGWTRINYNGKVAYVKSEFVK